MKQKLIDFMKFHNKNEHWPNIKDSIDRSIDAYLKSINEHPIECRNIIENEELKEFCHTCIKYEFCDYVYNYDLGECPSYQRKQNG